MIHSGKMGNERRCCFWVSFWEKWWCSKAPVELPCCLYALIIYTAPFLSQKSNPSKVTVVSFRVVSNVHLLSTVQ